MPLHSCCCTPLLRAPAGYGLAFYALFQPLDSLSDAAQGNDGIAAEYSTFLRSLMSMIAMMASRVQPSRVGSQSHVLAGVHTGQGGGLDHSVPQQSRHEQG